MPRQIIANTAAVAAGHPHGAAAGLEILGAGGNAVDAAVAAMIALSVVIPGSVGLGGYGGSAVIYLAGSRERGARSGKGTASLYSEQVVAVDFDSCAPLGFREGLVDPQTNHLGARSVTVPAVIAGLDLVLRELGTKSWREASQPAIRLAEEGVNFEPEHQRHLDRCAPKLDRQSLESLFPGGAVPRIGERWRQPDLAQLMRRLAEVGPAAFYEGEIAQAIVRYVHDRGGILTEEDFRCYRPRIVEPVQLSCRGFDLYTPPPPSGGITSFGIVQTVEHCSRGLGPWPHGLGIEPLGGEFFHIVAEATKLCWQERQQYLGDPDVVSIPTEQLVSNRAVEARAETIRTGRIAQSGQRVDQSPQTANVIAADADGNLISVTATQGWMYGSHLVVDGMGLVLNHGMSRFDYSRGHPNAPSAGKRMQHNMAPTIVLRGGRPAFAFGMPGGPKIVSVTAQLALDLIAFGAAPAASIAAPRLHTEGNEPLLVSSHTPDHVVAELEKLGHAVGREEDMGGPVNVLAVDPQTGKIDVASGEGTGDVAGF
ncbi:MAG: gamma-glutamyltransferase [Pirellulales bacterium]